MITMTDKNQPLKAAQANLPTKAIITVRGFPVEGSPVLVEFEGTELLDAMGISSISADGRIEHKTKKKKENICFDPKTGEVFIFNKRVGVLKPMSRDYHLFFILFERFPNTVDYKFLSKEVLKRDGKKEQAKTPENYCQTIKSDIKQYAPAVAILIRNFTTWDDLKGYKLISPSRQKVARK